MQEEIEVTEKFSFEAFEPSQFDEHIRSHLPWHQLVTGTVAELASSLGVGTVMNFGSSTGLFSDAVSGLSGHKPSVVNVEPNQEFMSFHINLMYGHDVGFYNMTMQEYFADESVNHEKDSLALCMMTLSFIPEPDRSKVTFELAKRYDKIIVVDKVSGEFGEKVTKLLKRSRGMSDEEIFKKEQSLIGVQEPIDIFEWFGDYGMVGKKFFQFGNFVGYFYSRIS